MKTNLPIKIRLANSAVGFAVALACGMQSPVEAAGTLPAVTNTTVQPELLMFGPVDQVRDKQSAVHLLGQWVAIPGNQSTVVSLDLVGQLVAIYGQFNTNGSFRVASIATSRKSDYVPGATQIYLKGQISAVNPAVGTAKIGQLTVSYSGALHGIAAAELSVGNIVAFAGVQYSNGNIFYANVAATQHDSAVNNIFGQVGSGTAGQVGSGKAAQVGSGTSGQVGSGTAGQVGSGKAGQVGSGTAGQVGSGKAGQVGSGTAGQVGSGKTGQAGSGTSGQVGSGKTGQVGSGTSGQVGSGTLGQVGSGKAGQVGSGTSGQVGSGTAGQVGSGKAGQVGSGTSGQVGSGTAGQVGSGKTGQVGSGTSGQVGSGT